MKQATICGLVVLLLVSVANLRASTPRHQLKTPPVRPVERIDVSASRLPIGYRGASIEKLFAMFSQGKQEFEKTSDYERRMEQMPLGAYAVRLDPTQAAVSTTYDADAQRLAIKLAATDLGDHEYFTISESTRDHGSYVGENGYGKKVRVKRQTLRLFTVWDMTETSRPLDSLNSIDAHAEDVSTEAARKLKVSVVAFVVLEITKDSPNSTQTILSHMKPRTDFPLDVDVTESRLAADFREIWFVDERTGTVLQKVPVGHLQEGRPRR